MSGTIEINAEAVSRAMSNVHDCLENTRRQVDEVRQVLEGVKAHHQSENATAIINQANNLDGDLSEIVTQMTMVRDEVYEKGNALLVQAGQQPIPQPA